MFDESKSVSRRQFLKIAGIAGATVGAGAGLGGLVAACGSGATTTTTAAPATPTTTAAAATTTTAAPETTTTAGVETGRPIKVGFVDPITGPLAGFGIAGSYCLGKWKAATANGLVLGDGKNHPFDIQVVDSQSDPGDNQWSSRDVAWPSPVIVRVYRAVAGSGCDDYQLVVTR